MCSAVLLFATCIYTVKDWKWINIFLAIGPSYVTCSCPNGYTGNGVGPNGCTLNPTDCSSGCRNGQCSVSFKF